MLMYRRHGYELFPADFIAGLNLDLSTHRFGNPSYDSILKFLCALAKTIRAPIVEFGTFTGRTTYNMALNTSENIYTLDIGKDVERSGDHDCKYDYYLPGERFLGTPEAARIELILGDSRQIDLQHLYDTVGLVFIDGGHDYETVKSDSEKAFKLIRDDGVIVWDDCNAAWPGVVAYLSETLLGLVNAFFLEKENMTVYYAPGALGAWGLQCFRP
jgi:predicted O-methyltransferase YrrM